jgi:hypothetical protein
MRHGHVSERWTWQTARAELPRHTATWIWAATFVIALIDAIWLAVTPLELEGSGFGYAALAIALLLAAGAFWTFVKAEEVLAGMALATAGLGAFTLAIAVFHYLAATLALPFADPQIAALEQALGFDWPSYVAALNEYPAMQHFLALAYHSSGPQIGVVVVVLSATRKLDRLWAFAGMFAMLLGGVIVVAALFPAVGPYAFYGVAAGTERIETVGAVWHLQPVEGLRSGALQSFALSDIRGLVTFPSFHICLALLSAWALASIPIVGPLAIALNVAVGIATISAGGHYLPDVLAGGAVALGVLGCHVARADHADAAAGIPKSLRIRSAVMRAPS